MYRGYIAQQRSGTSSHSSSTAGGGVNQPLHQVDHLPHHLQGDNSQYPQDSLQRQPYQQRTFRLPYERRHHQPYHDSARDRQNYGRHHGRPTRRDHHHSAGHVQEAHQQYEGHGIRSHTRSGISQLPQHGLNSRCQICSYTQPYPAEQKPVYHSHFSSLRRRELIGVEKSGPEYHCPSCKCSHGSSPDERIKIVLSDFTLHRFL